jgi:hypothetical protein
MYRSIGSSGVGAVRISELFNMFLRESSASYASRVHKWSDFFIRRYNGKLRSPSRAMKRLRAARQPVTHCTPFKFLIGPMSVMVEIFSRLLQCYVST